MSSIAKVITIIGSSPTDSPRRLVALTEASNAFAIER